MWILASSHVGDNTQLMAIAGALGWPFEVKRLAFRRHEELVRILGLATLSAVDRGRSSPLEPPWPDAILGAGRANEAVMRWIKAHGNPQAKTIFVGTPWVSPRHFDLVIATPQYRLPEQSNIVHLPLPAHGITPARIAEESARWAPRVSHLPEPRIAVLVGGASGPYTFSAEAAARLGRDASAMARARGGSLLVTTSARTPEVARAALEANLTVPHCFYRYDAAAGDNPFVAFLGLASGIIVTADSMSMLSEAGATGKPMWMFDIEDGPQSMRAEDEGAPIHWRGKSVEATVFRLLMRMAPPRWSRDLRVVHASAIRSGLARWLGEPATQPPRAEPPHAAPDSLGLAVARIRSLFGL